MAWIEKRQNGTYLVRWREGTRTRSEAAPTRDAARERKAELELEQARGLYVGKDIREQLFEDFAREMIAGALSIAESTRYSYEKLLEKWVYPEVGRLKVGQIDTLALRRALARMRAAGASPYLLQKVKAILSRVFAQALREGVVNRNPVVGLEVPKAERRDIVVLEPEQVKALADAIRPRYRLAVLLAAWGTLRIGEIGALKAEDFDWRTGTVTIRRAVSTAGGNVTVKEPKSRAGRRTVALPPFVMREAEAHSRWFADHHGWMFRTQGGQLLHHQTMHPIWLEACNRVGLEPRPRFHDLRHTAVAIMIREGAHPKVIQSRCGHATITMTMDTYGHLFPGTDQELAGKLERYA